MLIKAIYLSHSHFDVQQYLLTESPKAIKYDQQLDKNNYLFDKINASSSMWIVIILKFNCTLWQDVSS